MARHDPPAAHPLPSDDASAGRSLCARGHRSRRGPHLPPGLAQPSASGCGRRPGVASPPSTSRPWCKRPSSTRPPSTETPSSRGCGPRALRRAALARLAPRRGRHAQVRHLSRAPDLLTLPAPLRRGRQTRYDSICHPQGPHSVGRAPRLVHRWCTSEGGIDNSRRRPHWLPESHAITSRGRPHEGRSRRTTKSTKSTTQAPVMIWGSMNGASSTSVLSVAAMRPPSAGCGSAASSPLHQRPASPEGRGSATGHTCHASSPPGNL